MKLKSILAVALVLTTCAIVACKQPIDERYYRKTRGVDYSGGWEENKGYRNQRTTTVQKTKSYTTTRVNTSTASVSGTLLAENTYPEGNYNKSPIIGAPTIEQEVCPYGAIPGTCDCPAGLTAVDGVCTGVQCKNCNSSGRLCECYYGENMCGRWCNSDGKKCEQGACFAEEAGCDKISVGHWTFNPKLRTDRGGCENKAEKLSCVKNDDTYTCYRDGQYCGRKCNADGTACQYGMCIPQTCNNIAGRRWTYSHIGYNDYGYGCLNPEGNLKCTKDGNAYRCFWPRKGNNWNDVNFTYPCSKDGQCKNR